MSLKRAACGMFGAERVDHTHSFSTPWRIVMMSTVTVRFTGTGGRPLTGENKAMSQNTEQEEPGIQLSGRALTQHIPGPRFHPHTKVESGQELGAEVLVSCYQG